MERLTQRLAVASVNQWVRRVGVAIVAIVLILVGYAFLYQWAMLTFEGEHRTFANALQVVVETLTTAGFGGDTDAWNSTPMNLVVIAMNLSGVLLVFLALPLFVVPLIRESLQQPQPTTSNLTDHVIICGYSYRDEVLSQELSDAGVDYLYVDEDTDVVDNLLSHGTSVILGDSEHVATFHNANAERARAVVADINDEVNPTIILSADHVNPDLEIISVARRSAVTHYHRLAGADHVVEAPRVLGESLGTRARTSFAEKFRQTVEVETDFHVSEVLFEEDSRMIGKRLREIQEFSDAGVPVFGGWFDGKFQISPGADTEIEPNTILLIGGDVDITDDIHVRRLPDHTGDPGRVIVAGHGVVGGVVTETLERHGLDADVIDIEPHGRVDIVGDVTDPATFEGIDLDHARSIVLTLDRDTTTIFATLVINELAPELEIIARVHNVDNVWKVYNAGADFALSMATITGKMLASHLIEHREILVPQTDFEFVRTKAPAIAGQTLAEAHIRAETGCTVVGVERGDDFLSELGPDFEIDEDDVLIVAGTHQDTERLIDLVH